MYYCKNCGEPYMTDEAVMCIKCGVAKGQGNNYCHNCGKPLAPDAAVCLNCGVANKQAPAPDAKSKLVAGLLSIFLFVCWIMGLIYACQEQEKEVPLIGQIKILK